MANKLELTWYGKDEPIRVEPRLLIENAELSNTAADPETQNMLIHGDNLLALKAQQRITDKRQRTSPRLLSAPSNPTNPQKKQRKRGSVTEQIMI